MKRTISLLPKCCGLLNEMYSFYITKIKYLRLTKYLLERERGIWGATTSVILVSPHQQAAKTLMGIIFFDRGASLKNCSRRLQRTKPCRSFGLKADKMLAGLEQILPHIFYSRFVYFYIYIYIIIIIICKIFFKTILHKISQNYLCIT